jgi:hypothetical protein
LRFLRFLLAATPGRRPESSSARLSRPSGQRRFREERIFAALFWRVLSSPGRYRWSPPCPAPNRVLRVGHFIRIAGKCALGPNLLPKQQERALQRRPWKDRADFAAGISIWISHPVLSAGLQSKSSMCCPNCSWRFPQGSTGKLRKLLNLLMRK